MCVWRGQREREKYNNMFCPMKEFRSHFVSVAMSTLDIQVLYSKTPFSKKNH